MSLFLNYVLFLLKTITFVAAILVTLSGMIVLSKAKDKANNRIKINHLNERYDTLTQELQEEILSSSQLKTAAKKRKQAIEKLKKKERNRLFYLRFSGDMQATEVHTLREKITAVLSVATIKDEIVVNIESGGGLVHTYGLCASQLARIREQKIPLTVIIDKVAASGGYLMASVANQIIAAPFAIVGSIGVVGNVPNFHRFLKKHDIDFEQITAGEYKRTLTYFGENTPKGRQKFQEEIDNIHQIFKQFILQYRPQVDINEVATGEFWFGTDAIALKLIDKMGTSDDYLLQAAKINDIYEIDYQERKTIAQKLAISISKGLAMLKGSVG
ncbi:MAG: protease SohB [Legionellales bacterium]|nr:protease SohB [Legionellales bacterium]